VTSGWRETTPCPRCGVPVSTEQPIKAWIRANRNLDSRRACLCIGDSDLWVQRYGTRAHQDGIDRSVMYLMLVEIKTHARDLDASQRDLLHIVNQLLRTNPWKEQRDGGRFVEGHSQNARMVYSVIAGERIRLNCYGVHKLRLAGADPESSEWITWDDRLVTAEQLVAVLRYDLHPDSLRRMEHRNHKRAVKIPDLFGLARLLSEG
jgi:hypothetical protein